MTSVLTFSITIFCTFIVTVGSASSSQCPIQGTFEHAAPGWLGWPDGSTESLSYGSEGITYTVKTADNSCLYEAKGQYTLDSGVDEMEYDYLVAWRDWASVHQYGSCNMDRVAPRMKRNYVTFTPDCNTMIPSIFWGNIYTRLSGVELQQECSLSGTYVDVTLKPITYTYLPNGEVVFREMLEMDNPAPCWCEQRGRYTLSASSREGFQYNLTVSEWARTANDTSGCITKNPFCQSFSYPSQHWIRFRDICTVMVQMNQPVAMHSGAPYTRKIDQAELRPSLPVEKQDRSESSEDLPVWVWAVIGVEGVAVVFLLVLLVGSIVLMSRKRIVAEGPEDSGGDFL